MILKSLFLCLLVLLPLNYYPVDKETEWIILILFSILACLHLELAHGPSTLSEAYEIENILNI